MRTAYRSAGDVERPLSHSGVVKSEGFTTSLLALRSAVSTLIEAKMGNPRLLLIIPSRGRPGWLNRLAEACADTCRGLTEGHVGVDRDDPMLDDYLSLRLPDGWRLTVDQRQSLTGWTNAITNLAFGEGYDYLASIGDDHLPQTVGWDQMLMNAIAKKGGTGFAYGDDLAMRQNLPTAVVVSSNIPRALGWFCYVGCQHYCVDNVWKDIGTGAGCLTYVPEAIIEHRHYSTGKVQTDRTYLDAGGFTHNHPDWFAYLRWKNEYADRDIATVKGLLK